MNKSLNIFFKYLIVGYLLALVSVDLSKTDGVTIVLNSFIKFMYCFIVGIFIGMANMFGTDIYLWLKKN